MLREFVYVDRNRVEDFLSQLEGGVSDSTRQAETDANAGLEGGLNVGVARLAANFKRPTITQEDLRRTTDIALFERLYAHLQEDELQAIGDSSDLNWPLIRRGSLLELECDAVVSGISKLSQTLGNLQELAGLMGDPLEGASELQALFGGDPGIRFVLEGVTIAHGTLSAGALRTTMSDVEGECTVLVKVRKVVKSGKQVPLRSIGGMKLSVQQLEQLLKPMLAGEMPSELGFELDQEDLSATGPVMLVTPVAIYR